MFSFDSSYFEKIIPELNIHQSVTTINIVSGSKLTGSSRLKRSPYLYPYRQDYHQYFTDESKREVDGKFYEKYKKMIEQG